MGSKALARFANILETVGNTPIVKIGRLAPQGINLYVKIEAFNPLGSVKDRLALGVIEEAESPASSSPAKPLLRRRAATPASAWRWCARRKVTRWW